MFVYTSLRDFIAFQPAETTQSADIGSIVVLNYSHCYRKGFYLLLLREQHLWLATFFICISSTLS